MRTETTVRVSIATLAPYLRNDKTGQTIAMGIANRKKFEQERSVLFQALGGAVKITTKGRKTLKSYGAIFLGKDAEEDDARFVIGQSNLDGALKPFMNFLLSETLCENTPLREAVEELEQETFDGCTILNPRDLKNARAPLYGIFKMELLQPGMGRSERALAVDMPTLRLFYVSVMTVTDSVFHRIVASPFMYSFTESELDTTRMGISKGITREGFQMAGNLCNYAPGLIS